LMIVADATAHEKAIKTLATINDFFIFPPCRVWFNVFTKNL